MNEKNKNNKTKYGEFICSYFKWQTPSDQKKRAEELENITKSDNQKEN